MSFVNFCHVGNRARNLMLGTGVAIVLALVPANDLFAQSADVVGQKKAPGGVKSQKPGRERDLNAQRDAEKIANTAAKIEAERNSVDGSIKFSVDNDPCAAGPKTKKPADNRRVKAQSREAVDRARSAAAAGVKLGTSKLDCLEEPALDNADNGQDKDLPAGGEKIAVERRIQKPGRERDLSAEQAAAKIDAKRFSSGALNTAAAKNNPCSTDPVSKLKEPRRLVKKQNGKAGEQQNAASDNGSKLKIKKVDCPEEPQGKVVEDDKLPDGGKNGSILKTPTARRPVKDSAKPQSASTTAKPADVCGDPNRIAVLTPQEAQAHRNQLNSVLSKSGFTNAGQGQRVPLRWYFNLPFRTTVADMVGKRAAPVNDTAVLTKIMGFSTDCNVITSFSKDTQNAQPVTADYDVKVEFKKTDSDQFQSLGSFFKGAPASIFSKPGIFKLTATARGKLSPFKIGPVTHVVRVDSAALKRAFGITQLLIKNPGNITGTAFAIGSRKSAETDAKRHCKNYQFTAFARSGKIISESSSTIQTSRPSNKQYNKASFDLFQDDKLLDQQGPGAFYNFDAKKFGSGNFVLKARIARADQGPGPKNYQVPETQHLISVFRCGVRALAEIVKPGDSSRKPELGPIPTSAPKSGGIGEGGDIPGVIIHELEDGEVITDVLDPERFLKKVKAPTVAGPFLGSCEECKREIRRRHKVQVRSCDALVGSMQQLIFNVPIYNQKEIEYEDIFKNGILVPLNEIRAPQKEFVSQMKEFIEKAAKSGVLQTNSAQTAHQQALAKVAKRDRVRLAKNPSVKLSIPLIIQDDLPGRIGGEIFALVPGLVTRVNKSRSDFIKINTSFNDVGAEARAKAVAFVANDLPAILEKLQEKLDELKEIQNTHLAVQASIASTFASKSHEHCLGTPRGSKSVVASADGAAKFTEVEGIPGMNVLLKDHPDNRPSKEEFLAAAIIDPPKDQTFEGLEDFSPLKFKFDGVAYKKFEADFRRRFAELNGFFFTTAAAIGGGLQTTGKVIKAVGNAVKDFAADQAKAVINIGSAGLLFEGEAQKNLDNLVEFIVKDLPQGIDIVVGTDLAGLIIEANRVKQSDKFSGVKVLQAVSGFGVGQLAELVGKSTVEGAIAVGDAAALAFEQSARDKDFVGNFSDEVAEQEKINKGIGAGIVLALDLVGFEAIAIGAKFIKIGGKTFKTVDKAVDAANARRLKQGKKPLSAKEISKFRDAQSYATKADELIAKIRLDQKARLLAKAADRAKKLDELVDLSKANKLTDEIVGVVIGKTDDIVPPIKGVDDIVPPIKGVDDVVPPKVVAKLDDGVPPKGGNKPPVKGADDVVPPVKVAKLDDAVPPKKVVDGGQPPKKVVDDATPPKKVVDDAVPPKPVKRRVKEPNRNPKQPRRGSKEARARDAEELAKKNDGNQPPKPVANDNVPPKKVNVVDDVTPPKPKDDGLDFFRQADKAGDVAKPLDELVPPKPKDDGLDFFRQADDVKAADNVANKLDEAAEEAAKKAKAIEDLNKALARRRAAGDVGPFKPKKLDVKDVDFPADRIAAIDNPKSGDVLGQGSTTSAIKKNPAKSNSDVLKPFEKKSAADSKIIVDDQIAGAKKLEDAGANFLDIKGRGKVEVNTPIDGNGPPVKRSNDFLVQEQFPKDAIELEKLIDGRRAAGIKPLLSEAEQVEILRQFNLTSKKGLVLRDTNLGNIAAKSDGEALFVESGSVINAPTAKSAREAQAEHLFGEGSRFEVNQKTADIFKNAGDNKTNAQIRLNGPGGGASGSGGQGGFKDLISKDLQKKFRNGDEFDEFLKEFDAKKTAKAADVKKANQLVETAPRVTADEIKLLDETQERLENSARKFRNRAKNVDGNLTPEQIATAKSNAKILQDKADAVIVRKQARIQQFDPVGFQKFEAGVNDDIVVNFPAGRLDALNNPKPGDSLGKGQTTTALKLDPSKSDTSVLKAFDQLEGKNSRAASIRIAKDQIAGAKDLQDAGANFLAIEGKGQVTFKKKVIETVDGKSVETIVEVEHAFIIQKQLPPDAVELGDLVKGGTASGLKYSDVLDEAQQIEILRQFHLTSKKGLVLRDPNLGNIAVKADGEAIFIESGSIIKIGKDGVGDPNLARRAQSEHLFGTQAKAKLAKEGNPVDAEDLVDRNAINEQTAKIFEEAGQKDLADAIRTDKPLSGGSGNGGQGQLGLVIDPKLQKVFEDPVEFQKLLDNFDAAKAKKAAENTKASKAQLAEIKALNEAAAKISKEIEEANKLKLEANKLAGNQLDPVVLSNTPQFTPEQIKQVQKLRSQAQVADLKVKTAEKLVKAVDGDLAKARGGGASQAEIAALERARNEARGLLQSRNRDLIKVANESNELAAKLNPQTSTQVQADAIQKALDKKRKLIANDNNSPNDLPGQGGKVAGQ